ncbi:unnamed protein product [Pylaiella littoralis]
MPPIPTMPQRRVSMPLSSRNGVGGASAGASAASPASPSIPTNRRTGGLTKRQQLLLMEATSHPRLFPMLDDMVAGVVLAYLPSEELGISALISKAWLDSNSNESLWRPFLAAADPISTLGRARLAELAAKFSCKQVVTELSSRRCSFCREPTSGFFTLTCSRVCQSCFKSDSRVEMCSLSFAKSHYLLSDSQATALPTLYAHNAEETGVQIKKGGGMTITTCSAGKASALARWGTEEAFKREMDARKAKAEASYQTRVQAFNAAKRNENNKTSTSASPSAGGPTSQSKSVNRHPNRPRILSLSDQTNFVGVNQQEYHTVRGEKYGYFRVVNDAFFDAGPTIVISSMTTWACSDYVAGIKDNNMGNKYCGRECGERCARGDRGEALIRAVQNAQEGTTIKIANPVEVYEDIDVFRAVRLVGSSSAPLEMGEKSLALYGPSILRNLCVRRMGQLQDEDSDDDMTFDDANIGPAVCVLGDMLLDGCTFGMCPFGAAVMLQAGRLVAKANRFVESSVGLIVLPFSGSNQLETTVHLEGNHFKECYSWGVSKGPARCHLQDNDSILNTNTFQENEAGAIEDYRGD